MVESLILEMAKKEVAEENAKRAKEKVKTKLFEIEKAKIILANLERELDELLILVQRGMD